MNLQQQSARLRPFRPVAFGRYTLLSPLAVGGMGEIFLARLEGAKGFEKLCVIKKILPALAQDPELMERFVNEAKILVKLTHGSIAQVLDVGLFEGDPYIALEHVDGKDLRKIAGRARDRSLPLPLTLTLYVMSRVLDALAYAHRKRGDDEREIGLVHRDVSPQNILVSYEGEVKVIDFGLAKSSLSQARTNPSMILGKFLYMSPEQARHQKVDRRSDLYSAGLCLYELVCGKNPFDDVPPHELMSKVANPVIAPIASVDPPCPPAVQEMVARALEVDPAKRFQTAEEFRGRLMAALLEIDPSAGPESVSRYMRESFAQDYQQERRLLASLKSVERPAAEQVEPSPEKKNRETAVFALREVAPTQAAAKALQDAPPPTLKAAPQGPILPSPLSFAPTPVARETTEEVRTDGETVPGIALNEDRPTPTSQPTAPWDALPGGPPPDTVVFTPDATQPRVVLGEQGPSPHRADTQPGVVLGGLPDPRPSPVGGDTQPRVVLEAGGGPPPDTQPRVVLGDGGRMAGGPPVLHREETQPRVVLGTLLEDSPAPLPHPHGRARAPTRPANPLDPLPPEALPSGEIPIDPTAEVVTDEQRMADQDTGVRRRPKRRGQGLRWVLLAVGTLLLVGGAAFLYARVLSPMLAGPPVLPPQEVSPLSAIQPPPGPPPQQPIAAPPAGGEVPAVAAKVAAEDAGAAPLAQDAGSGTDAGGEALARRPGEEAGALEEAPVGTEGGLDDAASLLVPLTLTQPDPAALVDAPEPEPEPKRPTRRVRRRPRQRLSPELRRLNAAWGRAQDDFRALKKKYSCDVPPMKMLCFRMDALAAQMEGLEDERRDILEARRDVRSIHEDIADLERLSH